jgi:hypothetical protein
MVTRGKVDPPSLPATQRAYLAGLLDGEGHLSIILIRKSQHFAGRIPYYFRANVGIVSTTRELVDPFAVFGGVVRQQGTTVIGKPIWEWKGFDRTAWNCCLSVVEFLTLKKPLAQAILDFYGLRHPDYKGGKAGLPYGEVQRRIALMREIHSRHDSGKTLNEERIEEMLSYYRPQRLSERAPDTFG